MSPSGGAFKPTVPAPPKPAPQAGASAPFSIRLPGFPSSGEREPVAVLSDREVKQLRDKLTDAFIMYCDLADDTITRTNRKRAEAQIWSTIEREEAALLAELAIERGVSSPIAAQAVRGMVATSKYVRAGLILGPRAWETMTFYARNGGILLWA